MMEIWAVIVAGGSGTRFGRPKQLAKLGDRRVIDHAIGALIDRVAGIVVVGSADELGSSEELSVDQVVDGGKSRSASVRRGLAAVPESATHVLIHDAARPLASPALVGRVIDAMVDGAEAVVPVVPVTDTLRLVDGGTVDRSQLVAVQTPQGFNRATLMAAHDYGVETTDDAAVVELTGVPVVHVDGSPNNLKITFPHDLTVAEALMHSVVPDGEEE